MQKEVLINFVVTNNTTKWSFLTNMKDPVTKLASPHVVYHTCCSECYHEFTAKTERTLW